MIRYTCPRDPGVSLPLCASCKMSDTEFHSKENPAYSDRTIDIDPTDSRILTMINASDDKLKDRIREFAEIPKKCQTWQYEEPAKWNVEELVVAPDIDSRREERHITRSVFAIGGSTSEIEPNRSYVAEGITTRDPKNQKAVHLLHSFEDAEGALETFDPNTVAERLRIFQTDDPSTKWREIADDLSHNVTRIYGRADLLHAIDLVYHSVLEFVFKGHPVRKGWVEGIVLGDTRTGKSQSAQAILDHYGLGEFTTGDNSSFAGLVGGLDKAGGQYVISWGKIPLNDRRLLIIDEAGELSKDIIEKMSGIRSSGGR